MGRVDWLFDRCREVQASPNGHLDLWGREMGKSSIITFGLTIQDILNDPEITVGIFSHTRGIAQAFLRQIKLEFESNEELKAAYPDVLWANPRKEAPKWSELDGLIVKRNGNPKEATVEAWGLVDGQPTGRHFRLRVYDDVVTKESVNTAEQIRKTTEAWELSIALGVEGGAARYIGTRYNMGDTYHTMMERRVVKPRLYPATHDGTLQGRPVLLSAERLEAKRREMGSQFAAQMLLNPAGGIERMFDLAWLKSWEIRPRVLNVYLLGDPSKGRSARSDRTALAAIGIDAGGSKYLLDGMRHRMDLAQRWDALKTMHKRWANMPGVQAVHVGYEQYGLQTDLEYFEERMRIERYAFGITEVNWTRDGAESKGDRVGRLVPDLKAGRFRLPLIVWDEVDGICAWSVVDGKVVLKKLTGDTAPMARAKAENAEDTIAAAIRRVDEERRVYDLTRALVDEITFFPFGLHDDLVDAASRIYDMDPVPPTIVRASDLEPRAYDDGI